MNLADKLRKVLEIKNNIKTALEEKGIQDVGTDFNSYAESIANISGGGEPEEPEIPSIPEPPVIEIPELPKYEDVYAEALASIPEQEPWVQPEDWIDLRTVLAENVIEEYPYRIAMMVEDTASSEFSFHSNTTSDLTNIVKPNYILCSDGVSYNPESISQMMIHTWSGEAVNGYRWMIFYFESQSVKFPIGSYSTIQIILDGISINAYSGVSSRVPNGSLIMSSTYKELNINTVSIESINSGNIYSYDKPSSWSTNYYSIFNNITNLVYVGEGVINERYTSSKELFKNCFSLKYIPTLNISLFAKNNVFNFMFQNCSSLVTIPLIDTSNGTDFQGMFQNCSSLVTIPLIDTSKASSLIGLFKDCNSLITIPELDLSSVTDVTNMFQNCSSLVTIPVLNTSNVTCIAGMFQNCSSLVTIPLIDTSNVTEVTGIFSGCRSLKTIPELNTSNVTSFSSMFRGCKSLVTIPLIDTSKATNLSSMFYGCSSLVFIPELDFSSATYISDIFRDSSLEVLPQLNLPLMTSSLALGKSFEYIIGINAPLISGFDSSFFTGAIYVGRLDCPKVTKYSFSGSTNLKYIEYIDTTSLTDCSSMFSRCSSLKSIPELNTSNGTNFNYMFNDCKSLITIPELNTSNGTSFMYMFKNCSSLKTIPELDTTNSTTFYEMFNGCSSLEYIPELNTSNCTSFYRMFYGCSSLKSIPELNTSNGTNFYGMFDGCKSLITIPELNTKNGTEFGYMFSDCDSLLTIPELDLSNATSLNYFINNCDKLEIVPSIYLPKSTKVNYLVCACNNIKEFGDLRFPAATSSSSLFYQSSFNYVSEIGAFDLSSYSSSSNKVDIPANPNLLKKVKIVGNALKRGIDFSSSGIPVFVREYEADALDCDMSFNYWVALTKQSLLNILNALVEQPEGTTKTLTLNKTYHIPQLSDEEKAIAINKGWTISEGTYTLS